MKFHIQMHGKFIFESVRDDWNYYTIHIFDYCSVFCAMKNIALEITLWPAKLASYISKLQ